MLLLKGRIGTYTLVTKEFNQKIVRVLNVSRTPTIVGRDVADALEQKKVPVYSRLART